MRGAAGRGGAGMQTDTGGRAGARTAPPGPHCSALVPPPTHAGSAPGPPPAVPGPRCPRGAHGETVGPAAPQAPCTSRVPPYCPGSPHPVHTALIPSKVPPPCPGCPSWGRLVPCRVSTPIRVFPSHSWSPHSIRGDTSDTSECFQLYSWSSQPALISPSRPGSPHPSQGVPSHLAALILAPHPIQLPAPSLSAPIPTRVPITPPFLSCRGVCIPFVCLHVSHLTRETLAHHPGVSPHQSDPTPP